MRGLAAFARLGCFPDGPKTAAKPSNKNAVNTFYAFSLLLLASPFSHLLCGLYVS